MIIRYLVLLFSLLVFDFLVQEGDVKMNLVAPGSVDAGTSFKVEITLTKSQLEGFSRFAQDIPAGLIATAINTANADFTFQDNRVRFIWLKLPEQDTFTISYSLKVDERLKGNFALGGKFSFIDNNERKTIDLAQQEITIRPSATIDPRLIVDIKDFKEKVIPNLIPVKEENIACVRQKPDLSYSEREILVNVLVSKGNKEKFAKIEEQIPAGYTAVALDKKDAIFTFRDQVAKFLWMNLPADPYFTVSYKLIPDNKQRIQSLGLKGAFSYVDEGKKTASVDIVEQDYGFENLTQARVNEIIKGLPGAISKEQAGTQLALLNNKTNTQGNTTTNTGTKTITTSTDTGKLVAQTNTNAQQTKTNISGLKNRAKENIGPLKETGINAPLPYMLEPEKGVYFRVQLAAGHRPVDIRRYFKRLQFRKEIRTEQHEGWYKYSVGSWGDYKEARDFRLHVWSTTPVKDAFIAAYNGGKRITVQEALMIANQRWYK
jgi:hypothetical protein